MDRSGKSTQGRGGKAKIPQYPADLFALGTKSSSETKRPGVVHNKPSTSHTLPSDRKREQPGGTLPSGLAPAKKQKAGVPNQPSTERTGSRPSTAEAWEMVAVECEPTDLVPSVLEASDLDEADRVVGLICGALRVLRSQRWKPDMLLYTNLCYLAKVRPSLLASDCVVHALASLLRRDTTHSFKSKGNPVVPVLAANLLMRAFQDKRHWPELFLKLYVEDSLGERVWVDQEDCAGFVNNIITALNTRVPPRSFLQPEMVLGSVTGSRAESCASPLGTNSSLDDEVEMSALGEGNSVGVGGADSKEKLDVSIVPRYSNAHETVEQVVMDVIREQLNRRQPAENITRNFLRLMSSCCGLAEVRLAAVPRLELWMQNPKLMRPAQELLMAVCLNCNTHSQRDVEVISQLVKIRLKTKALINLYLTCIRELISAHPDNLSTVLKHTIYNELSTARNPNNMAMLAVMFQAKPEESAGLLAEIFLELLLNREDYLRPLRALLREVVRVLRHDLSLTALCRGLLQERKEPRDFEFRDRMFVSIADLITLCIFLGISPSVREASSLLARGDKRELTTLHNYQTTVAQIQRDSLWWLHNVALKVFRPEPQSFVHALHKILFVDHPEQYYNKDNWPPENERGLFMRLATEVPLLQKSLLCILLIGISKEHPMGAPDVLELADQVVKRAAAINTEGLSMLQADKLEIIDLVFNLTAYHHPDNINLPAGYCPPHLAITNLYWKAWIMLLMLAAHNPMSFGSVAWEKYPTLRVFMEMCITNHFQFPPPTMSMGEGAEEARSKELQVAALEKQQILEFESYLAAASTKQTITEQTSLLLCQLITLDPLGPPRQPPSNILEQLKNLNNTHRMGHLLCRSRRPDFLLDIIQRQGTSQSMPWLADLVENSEGAFSHLPVQCLCEFLLSGGGAAGAGPGGAATAAATAAGGGQSSGAAGAGGAAAAAGAAGATSGAPEKQAKHQKLLRHLQRVLTDPDQDPTAPSEVLEYFLRRLGSSQTTARVQAIRGLKQVLSSVLCEEEVAEAEPTEAAPDNCNWLLRALPMLPHFPAVRMQAVQALRQACQVENEPVLVSSYICFLAAHTAHDTLPELGDLVLDMAQLIVERSSIVAAILPSLDNEVPGGAATQRALMLMFHSFLQRAREPRQENYPWSDSQDQILVHWSTGEQAVMHVLIVHAIIILLHYGPVQEHDELFESLLDMWFPVDRMLPKAYLVMTSEEALLIPDWLKLRMIRSNVDRLVDAALTDLEPGQLVLFIQSFGIPVQSMSKLLHTLDRAVLTDPGPVGEAVLDKSYMAQLVEVQHHRGAQGGRSLVEVLHLEQQPLPEYQQEKESRRRRPLPRLPIDSAGSDVPVLIETAQRATTAMAQLFAESTSPATQRQLFKSLQRSLAMEIQRCSACGGAAQAGEWPVVEACAQWLACGGATGPPPSARRVAAAASVAAATAAAVAAAMATLEDRRHLSAPLLRLLASAGAACPALRPRVRAALRRVASACPRLRPALRSRPLCAPRQAQSTTACTDTELSDPVEALLRCPPGSLERVGTNLLERGEKEESTQLLVESLAHMLSNSSEATDMKGGRSPQTPTRDEKCEEGEVVETRVPAAHVGLLIDWLVALEPELIGTSPDKQMELLFAPPPQRPLKAEPEDSPVERSGIEACRPYLLSLLTHRASWPTLHRCMTRLLERCDPVRYHPPAVLDFLKALTCNPRLWQGRDRFTPKHHRPEDVLGLTLPQILVLAEYIVSEAEAAHGCGLPSEDVLEGMEERMPLLLRCLEGGDYTATLARHLISLVKKKSTDKESKPLGTTGQEEPAVANLLLLLLYLRLPAVLRHLSDMEREALWAHSAVTAHSSSLLDTTSHTLLTALSAGAQMSAGAGKDWARRAHEYELLARKMAASHPVLVLRQLPMLAGVLQGRVHLELPVFRARHHLSLFGQVLGLLELLRPYLFTPEHSTGLHSIMSCYIALARQHGHAKDVAALLVRVVALLQAYVAADTVRASKFLQQHAVMLSDLQHVHPSLGGLRSLLGSLSLPRASGGGPYEGGCVGGAEGSDGGGAGADAILAAVAAAPSPAASPHHAALLQALSRSHADDLMLVTEVFSALQELEHMSSRKPSVLEAFVEVLSDLLVSPAGNVRGLAHTLILRYLRHDPSGTQASLALAAFARCLDSELPDVLATALDRMPEVAVCAQEHALPLAQKAFRLGIYSSVNALPCITKMMSLLNVQTGC